MQFRDKRLEEFWDNPTGGVMKRLDRGVRKGLYRKLQMLDAARDLCDLRIPPGNRLEALSGTRRGQFSIRVNGQWRLCFVWEDCEAKEVELCDYHR